MENPDTLVDAVRDKLKALADLVALVDGNPDRILSYEDGDVAIGAAVYEMQSPSIVVAWLGNDEADEGNARFVHRIAVYFRLGAQRLGAAFLAMCNSVAASDSQKFTEAEFHPSFVLRGLPVFSREQDEDGTEYPVVTMRFEDISV